MALRGAGGRCRVTHGSPGATAAGPEPSGQGLIIAIDCRHRSPPGHAVAASAPWGQRRHVAVASHGSVGGPGVAGTGRGQGQAGVSLPGETKCGSDPELQEQLREWQC